MALQYDYRAVKKTQTITLPNSLGLLSAVDLGEVTKSNVDEIAFRLKFAETCGHNFLHRFIIYGFNESLYPIDDWL